MTINPNEISVGKMHSYLLGAIAPRPVALASTIDAKGAVNLSPFSFFNCFGANPPLLIFSPARRGRDNTTKHTYENVLEVPEVVINIVNYAIVHQVSLASTEYEKGINEFIKSGLTPMPSLSVKPPRVAESPAAFECKVLQVIPTGDKAGAGNLVICEVVWAHFNDDVLDAEGKIDPFKIDAVARMGGDWYCRANGDSLFKIPKPTENTAIGFDQLPMHVRSSNILTGNDLAILAGVDHLPNQKEIDNFCRHLNLKNKNTEHTHTLAQHYLRKQKVMDAWKILLNQ